MGLVGGVGWRFGWSGKSGSGGCCGCGCVVTIVVKNHKPATMQTGVNLTNHRKQHVGNNNNNVLWWFLRCIRIVPSLCRYGRVILGTCRFETLHQTENIDTQ